MRNPWTKMSPPGYGMTETVDVNDRLKLVARFDVEKLRQVAQWPGTQQVVKRAAERRIRDIQKSLKAAIGDQFEKLKTFNQAAVEAGLVHPTPHE